MEVRRPPRRRRYGHWFILAAAFAVAGVVVGVFAVLNRPHFEPAAKLESELVLTTPILSARRIPDVVSRPTVLRNFAQHVQPLVDSLPSRGIQACVQFSAGPITIYGSAVDAGFIPASNMKVLTAAAALDLLGPETTLTTRFLSDTAPVDGVINGNLYIQGGGDPVISTADYVRDVLHRSQNGPPEDPTHMQPVTAIEPVADQLVALGITHVTGSIVGDETRYDSVRTVESWPERFFSQGQVAKLSALLVNDSRAGSPWSPATNPPLHVASVMHGLLTDRGVQVDGAPLSAAAPDTAHELHVVPSPTIQQLSDQLMRFSDNTTAEMLVKELGLQHGSGGSTAAGLEVLRDWLNQFGTFESLVVADGSGLSDLNKVPCQLLINVLNADGPDGLLAHGMATPGDPGTLSQRMRDGELTERVRAKTGSLRTASTLGGWLQTRDDVVLSFALLLNTTHVAGTREQTLHHEFLAAALSYPEHPNEELIMPEPARVRE